MRSFHFARAAILTQVAGFGKNVVPFFGFWMRQGFLLIGPQLMHGLRKNRSLRRGRKFGGVVLHKFYLAWLMGDLQSLVGNSSLRRAAETEAVIRFEPAERGHLLRV